MVALLVAFSLCAPSLTGAQAPFDTRMLAEYRLTVPVFKRFAHATKLIAAAMRADSRFDREPLFSKDVSVAGDAAAMATQLQHRLDSDAVLSTALFAADMDAREYATFAISLFAARLAHGFITSGALRRVPEGVPSDNVTFVREHQAEVTDLLKQLQLE